MYLSKHFYYFPIKIISAILSCSVFIFINYWCSANFSGLSSYQDRFSTNSVKLCFSGLENSQILYIWIFAYLSKLASFSLSPPLVPWFHFIVSPYHQKHLLIFFLPLQKCKFHGSKDFCFFIALFPVSRIMSDR